MYSKTSALKAFISTKNIPRVITKLKFTHKSITYGRLHLIHLISPIMHSLKVLLSTIVKIREQPLSLATNNLKLFAFGKKLLEAATIEVLAGRQLPPVLVITNNRILERDL